MAVNKKDLYFLNTQFQEVGGRIDLISIAVVSGDSREFYRGNSDFVIGDAGEFVAEKVLPPLGITHDEAMGVRISSEKIPLEFWQPKAQIAIELTKFCGGRSDIMPTWLSPENKIGDCFNRISHALPDEQAEPQFWSAYSAYHWVAVCQLYGRLMYLPMGFPQLCHDVAAIAKIKGVKISHSPKQFNALINAHWVRSVYMKLENTGALEGVGI